MEPASRASKRADIPAQLRTLAEVRADRAPLNDGGLTQALTACTHELRPSVMCLGFGAHWIHSGTDEQGEWIFWSQDRKISFSAVDSGHTEE